MIFQVHGARMSVISCEVEADTEEEALEKAEEHWNVDVWHSEDNWNFAIPVG